jgi:hypothetical protein
LRLPYPLGAEAHSALTGTARECARSCPLQMWEFSPCRDRAAGGLSGGRCITTLESSLTGGHPLLPRGERTPCWLVGTAAARVTTIYQRARRQIYRLTAPSDRSAACTLAGASTSAPNRWRATTGGSLARQVDRHAIRGRRRCRR